MLENQNWHVASKRE